MQNETCATKRTRRRAKANCNISIIIVSAAFVHFRGELTSKKDKASRKSVRAFVLVHNLITKQGKATEQMDGRVSEKSYPAI